MPYNIYNLEGLRNNLSDRYEGVVFWSNEEANAAINEALRNWNLLTGMWFDTVDIDTIADQQEYDLDSMIMFGTRVEYNGRGLGFSFLADMDNGRPGWQGQTTATGGNVPTEPEFWIPLGLNKIMIWPADHDGGNILTVDGIAATPVLVDDTDFLDMGSELVNPLLDYAIHVLAFKEGGERFATTLPLYQSFLDEAIKKNVQLKKLFSRYIESDIHRQNPAVRK